MSQVQNNNKTIETLPSEWTLWFSYSSDVQNDTNYGSNLMKIQKLKYWNDFALIWTWVSSTQKFFVNPQNGTLNKYKFGNQERKIDSLNFFKNDNQPQWQFGDNPKYGYFNFGIDKNDDRINDIYEATVFLALGCTQNIAQNIIGIRIVDLGTKPNHPARARVQIWVDFRHDNSKESFKKLSHFQEYLQKYYLQKIRYELNQVKFFNISNQEGDEAKTPKKHHSNQGNKKNAHQKYKKN